MASLPLKRRVYQITFEDTAQSTNNQQEDSQSHDSNDFIITQLRTSSSKAPNARSVAFCASVNPLIPVILSRS
jgi:hypothetical protein